MNDEPRLGINDFLEQAWTLTDGYGFDFAMASDQWWGIRFECWCPTCDPENKERGTLFRQTSYGPLDVEETLYKLMEKIKEAHGNVTVQSS